MLLFKRIIGSILFAAIVSVFCGTIIFTLPHSHGKVDHSHGHPCPLMGHDEAICPMQGIDHLALWRDALQVPSPSPLSLLIIIGSSVTLALYPLYSKRSILIRVCIRWLQQRLYTFFYHQLQPLFSSGILHTKVF
jgi:hypothetical protein